MEKIEPIEVPASHIAFAEAVAALAEKNGIESFELKYAPHWERNGGQEWDRRVRGEAVIRFSDKDGRGRPCRNLCIEFDAHVRHQLVSTEESSSCQSGLRESEGRMSDMICPYCAKCFESKAAHRIHVGRRRVCDEDCNLSSTVFIQSRTLRRMAREWEDGHVYSTSRKGAALGKLNKETK